MKLYQTIAIICCLALSGCGVEAVGTAGAPSADATVTAANPTSQSPTPAPTATSTPAPTPTPTPTATPTETPAHEGDGHIVVVSEGSSSAVAYDGSHTGMYRNSRSDIEFHGLAVGGSTLITMMDREQAVLDLHPDLVSIYIGSNDIAITKYYPSVDVFIAKLKEYIDPIRASGARVVLCTLLPKQIPTSTTNDKFNAIRKEFNEKIKKVDWIDGIVDFGGDPEMGPDSAPFNQILFQPDGQHPTAGANRSPMTGQERLFHLYQPVMDQFVADVR